MKFWQIVLHENGEEYLMGVSADALEAARAAREIVILSPRQPVEMHIHEVDGGPDVPDLEIAAKLSIMEYPTPYPGGSDPVGISEWRLK